MYLWLFIFILVNANVIGLLYFGQVQYYHDNATTHAAPILVLAKDNDPVARALATSARNSYDSSRSKTKQRFAVAQFLDSPMYMYGAFSLKHQMERFDMMATVTRANKNGDDDGDSVEQVAVIPNDFRAEFPGAYQVLQEWLNNGNSNNGNGSTSNTNNKGNNPRNRIYEVDKNYILDKLDDNLWKGTFNKLWLFNLTEYDKVIVLDADVLVRQSLMHWFYYDTPTATQSFSDTMIWNSGAMVITPNTTAFDEMIEVLPTLQDYEMAVDTTADGIDHYMSSGGRSDQDFLSTFFTHPEHARMKTMPSYASVISTRLSDPKTKYWTKYRRQTWETVHFTGIKPWKKFATRLEIHCELLREWKASVNGVEEYHEMGLPPLPFDYLRNCPTSRAAQTVSEA